MSSGVFLYFSENFFDVKQGEFTFDLEKADVKVMLLEPGYCTNGKRDKVRDDLLTYEIEKDALVKHQITKLKTRDPLASFSYWTASDKTETGYVYRPNGYSGPKSVGPLYSKNHEKDCLNSLDEWITYIVTVLYVKGDSIVWGGDDELEKYPNRATLNIGSIVYYLDLGDDKESPLIAYHTDVDAWACENGKFVVTHSPDGLATWSVRKDDIPERFDLFGAHWDLGAKCRKKTRTESLKN